MRATNRSIDGARRRRVIGAVAALGVLLGTAWTADADDRKNYPGAMCLQQGSARTVQYDGAGRVLNPSAASVSLVCPIVRDHTDNRWNSITVRVVDRNTGTGDVSCQTRRISAFDGSITIVETQRTAGFQDTPQTLTFDVELGFLEVSFTLDTYVLTCSLPPNNGAGPSAILSYSVLERD